MKKKIFLILFCTIIILGICGCGNQSSNNLETTNNEKNHDEEIYLLAKEYYANKEYSYACQDFSFIRGYKDVDEILNSDKYFKLCGNEYEIIDGTHGYLINFDFSDVSGLSIVYTTVNSNGNGELGACKIDNGRVFIEQTYKKGDYVETSWSIKEVNDDSIVVGLKNSSYVLYKK